MSEEDEFKMFESEEDQIPRISSLPVQTLNLKNIPRPSSLGLTPFLFNVPGFMSINPPSVREEEIEKIELIKDEQERQNASVDDEQNQQREEQPDRQRSGL